MPEYAEPVIDWLDAGRGIFTRRYFREVGVVMVPSSLPVHAERACTAMYTTPERIIYQGFVQSRARPLSGLPNRQLTGVL